MSADVAIRDDRTDYLKRENGGWKRVIYEIHANGAETFSDQEPGEVRWFEFQPSERERLAARRVLSGANGRSGKEPILDLDSPVIDGFAQRCSPVPLELPSQAAFPRDHGRLPRVQRFPAAS